MSLHPRLLPAALLALAPAARAQQLLEVVHHHENVKLGGPSYFGASVSRVGDLLGDGTDDFAVGCPRYGEIEYFDIGKAFLWYTHNGTTLEGPQITGEFASQFGYTVAGVGDVDGDGVPDAVMAYGHETKLIVVSGAMSGPMYTLPSPDNSFLGRVVVGPGDVNQDGFADLVVSRNFFDGVFVFRGNDGGLLYSLAPAAPNEAFGFSLGRLGDVDGDGRADFLVGAPNAAGGGAVRAISGIDGHLIREYLASAAGESFGAAVAGGGDANGDGVGDLLVSAPGAPGGAVRLFSGAGATLLASETGGPAAGVYELAWLGDADEDGASDWAAGGTNRVGVYSGASTGQAGGLLYDLFGPPSFASSISAGGDLDGDGRPDLIVGVPWQDDVYLYSLVPAGETLFGTGTAGCAHQHALVSSGVPAVGNATFELRANHGNPGVVALALVADAADHAGNDFLGLGILGYLDLAAATELYSLTMTTDAAGYASAPLAIPNNPGLAGKTYFAQAFFAWMTGCAPGGAPKLSSSSGLTIQIQ